AERDARLGFQTAEARNAYYLAFEDRFRGSASVIRQRLEVYDALVEQLPREASDLAIDLGAGRGEWLDLLRDHGLRGIGIDVNARMVAACREKRHEAHESDALEFLESLDDDSVVMVTGFHLIEHLSFDYLVSLVDQTLRVLVPGGVALFETPNPENVFTSSCYFHMDFTHVRPIPPASSQFLLEQRGFSDVEILRQNVLRIEEPQIHNIEAEHPLASRLNPAIDILNQRFLDAPDYAVLGHKAT
ncbi:MAG: class I SAM-dependent methyltransferase, partial [Acidobacteriota bacterium]